MKHIVTLTVNPSVDKSTSISRVIAERKLRCGAPRYDPGGGGINVSRAIGHLGGRSTAIFTSGGSPGNMLEALLASESVDAIPVPIKGMTREDFSVCEDATGQQYRFIMPGPELSGPEWQACLSALEHLPRKPEIIVASGSLPPGVPDDFYARAAAIALKLSASFLVDTSGEALRQAVEHGVTALKVNIDELSDLAGREIRNDAEIEIAGREIVERGKCSLLSVSLGPGGAAVYNGGKWIRVPSPTVPIKSKVGAGDSMVGGMTLALARGLPFEDAVRFGVASGAAAVMAPGSQLCRREDAEALYERMK